MELVDHVVANGLWFTKGGVAFKIGNEENAAALYLSRYAKKIISYYPKAGEWISAHPSPKTNIESVIDWYRKLGTVFIEDEGWHLLWRGVLYTNAKLADVIEEYGRLAADFKTEVNLWPPDTRIDVYRTTSAEKAMELSRAALSGETDLETPE